MTAKQFTKADLQDGDICTAVNGEEWYYVNGVMVIATYYDGRINQHPLSSFKKDLEYRYHEEFSIISVERKGKIIWTKPEGNKVKQEIESIRKQQEELAKRLKELEKTIDN